LPLNRLLARIIASLGGVSWRGALAGTEVGSEPVPRFPDKEHEFPDKSIPDKKPGERRTNEGCVRAGDGELPHPQVIIGSSAWWQATWQDGGHLSDESR